MRTNNMTLETLERFTVRLACGFASTLFLLLFLSLVVGFASTSFAQEPQARMFSSPGEASDALFQAAQKEDEATLEAILGAGKGVTSSSDEEEDKLEHEQFSKKYQEMHRLVQEPDGTTVLYIGAENWPFPIPLVSKNGEWYFDSARGKQEILFRRVGENEATAIEVCKQFAVAKNEANAQATSEDPITQFVQSLVSGAAEKADNKESNLFYGYHFRIVTRNSASQASSQSSKNEGWILVAYPAGYQSSGVMTFVVSRGGTVYEKDLGPSTTTVAPKIKARNGSGWRPAA
ncbi:MAG: DUF2950 family protein [Terriglobales bacterium]